MSVPKVLYEDDKFYAFYKPPYFIMDTVPYKYENLSLNQVKKLFQKEVKPFHVWVKYFLMKHQHEVPPQPDYNICQRLDINTSGIVLVAKKNIYHDLCRKIINDKVNTKKLYICLVNGIIEKKSGFILNNIICDKRKFSYCKTYPFDSKIGQHSCSYYQVLQEYKYENNYYSLVVVRIFTGRTHQIRVHMKSLGTPIVADDRYLFSSLIDQNKKIAKRMFLHNILLQFTYNNKTNTIIAPLADDLVEVLSKLTLIKKYKFDPNIFTIVCSQLTN